MHRRHLLLSAALACPPFARAAREPLLFGAEDDWFPYSGVVGGQPQGLSLDLVRAAMSAAGRELRFESMPYARCMSLTRSGGLVACFDTIRTAPLEADYLWPEQPMFDIEYLIYARADYEVPSAHPLVARDLEGQRVAVTRGYEYGDAFDTNPRILRETTSHDESNFGLLLRGRAVFTICAPLNAQFLFKRRPDFAGRFKVVGSLGKLGIHTVFSPRHPLAREALADFERGMRLIRAGGQYRQIQERWKALAERP